MSQFDSLGETTFSINDPTIEKAPPFKYTRAIAYNGSYWLAAGTIVIRSVGIKTFLDVKNYEESADNRLYWKNSDAVSVQYTDAQTAERRIKWETEYNREKELAKIYFNDLKIKNYVPQSYTWKSVHCFAKSTDGYTWKYVEECPLTYASIPYPQTVGNNHYNRINGLAWNGSKWMAVGRSIGAVGPNSNPSSPYQDNLDIDSSEIVVVESSDGDTWEITGSGSFGAKSRLRLVKPNTHPSIGYADNYVKEASCVTCDTTKWIVGTDAGLFKKGFTETSWTLVSANIERTHFQGIATDGTTWVAVGGGDTKSGFYDGSINNAGAIVSSTNGTTWTKRVNWDLYPTVGKQTFKAVAWNGDRWIAVGVKQLGVTNPTYTGLIARSEDGIDWTITEGFSTGLSCVAWDGNQWIVGSTNENVLESKDGFLWTPTAGSTSGVLTVATKIVLPIIGGDINTVQSLLVGAGNPTSVLRTYNDTEWIPQILTDSKKQFQSEIRKNFYGALWSGTKWIIVGEKDVFGRSVAVSENGIDWTYPTSTLGLGRSVAYGSGIYIAVGDKVVTSTDTETWTAQTSPIKNLHCVAHNGTIWVAGGDGGVQYSTNGTTWTKSTTCPLSFVRGVAWNGSYWVGTGTGLTHSIMLSKDGMRWYTASETTIPLSEGYSVAWNQSLWIATGSGNYAVAKSYDGYTWETIASTPITSGQYVAWTGTKWLVSGYGTVPIVSSTDAETWTDYPILLTRGSAYVNKNITLPITGTSSQTVLDKVNLVLTDLTTKTNATIAKEQEIIDEAAALIRRNSLKSSATDYLNRISFWNTKVAEQFAPFLDTQYVDMSSVYPVQYTTVFSKKVETEKLFASANVYRDRIYDDTRSEDALNFDLDNLALSVKVCEETMVDFYNAARVLYSQFATEVYTALAVTPGLLSIVDGMGFSTQTKNTVTTFISAKQTALSVVKNDIVDACSTPVLDITYPNATDYATLFKQLLTFDITTLSQTYQTDDTNAFFFLSIWNHLYPKIYAKKLLCDELVTTAHADAVKWATLLGTAPPTLQSVKDEFEPIYAKYFRSVGTMGYPVTTFDTPNKLINLTDTPVRSFKALANDYKNPLAYPTGLQSLYNRLKTTTDTVESTRQAAVAYMINKRKTTLKTKLDDIFSVTKTKYTGSLALDDHISKVTNIVYNKDSNYAFCIDLLKKLKNGYIFGSELRQTINAIELADIVAEEDGCAPPVGGWGVSPRGYAYFTFPLNLGVEFTSIGYEGNRYLIGDEIVIPGTKFKGLSPTNDITITVKDVGDFDGQISIFQASGVFPSQSTPYVGLIGSRTQNFNAGFNVLPSGSTYTVTLMYPGDSYVAGQKINLSGANFRRSDRTNDVLIDITGVDGIGRITSFASSGSSIVPTYDDIPGYKNSSCAFTFLQGLIGMPSGQNFIIFLENGGVGYKVGDKIVYEGTRFGGLSPANDIVITVSTVNSQGSILTFTYEGTPSVLCTYGFTLNPIENKSATFTFSNITNSTTYTATVKNGGSNYRVGERLLIPGTSFTGGKSPANDFVLKVNTVSATGAILTISVEGSFSFLFQQFSAYGNVVEQNASFDVIVNYSPTQSYAVSLNFPGDGYLVNESIIIPGTLLNGKTPDNDLTIIVTGVSENGGITSFTSAGTPKTEFQINTKPTTVDTPYKFGRYGMNGWQYFNDTFTKRDDLARYMYSNSISNFGALRTYKLPDISGTDSIRWRTFLDFISTSTYDTIVDAIEELEDKVDLLNANNELTQSYVDNLVTADLNTIQSKYIEFATTYTQSLLDSVNTVIASAKFSVAKSGGVYTATLVNAGYGYEVNEDLSFAGTSFGGSSPANNLVLTVKTVGPSGQILTFVKKSGTASSGTATYVVTNNKLADRFTEIADAQATIEANYSTLYNAPGSIPGKTNEQIATIVTDAIAAKNTITSIQNNTVGFPTIIQKAINYLKYYNQAKKTVLDYEDDLVRWINMKKNAYNNSPFYEPRLSNGVGEPFIMSIPPTNTNFWAPINYTLYKTDPKSDTIYQCTLDEQTGKVKTTFDPIDITTVDEYSASQSYVEGAHVKYNNVIYVCKKDATVDSTDPLSQTGVRGVSPLQETNCWVTRRYPYVIDGNEEVEFNDSMSVPFDANQFLTYSATREYKLGTIVKFEGLPYSCSKTVDSDSTIKGISPDYSTYWREITYPLVRTLSGLQFEANPTTFSAVDANTLTDALSNSYKFGDFAKTTVTFVDDQGYYRTGTFTFQLDQEPTSSVSKGYSPVLTYANGDKYQNYLMWEYVQEGRVTGKTHPTYSESSIYKRDDYVVYTGSFIKQDGTTTSNVLHTFKLIATYPSQTAYYGNSIINPFYKVTASFPVATKAKGVAPTETPWSNLGLATLSDAVYPMYSSETEYNLNDIVRYTVSSTTYKYQFVGTLPKYESNTTVYVYFGKVSGNKNPWSMRSYPGVYYNNAIVEPTPGNIPALNVNNYTAYDADEDYSPGDYVSYNNKVYLCGFAKVGVLYGIPVTNDNYWTPIRYKVITYNGDKIQAAPGSVPKLNPDDYDEYDEKISYRVGDIVKVTQPASNLNLSSPQDIVTDRRGNIYVMDRGNKIIKKGIAEVDQYTVANIGIPYGHSRLWTVDGTTSTAMYYQLGAVDIDDSTDTIYFTDDGSIRKIAANGAVNTIAGYLYLNGISSGYVNATGTAAKFSHYLDGLCFDKDLNCLYVADSGNNAIRKINLSNNAVTTHAGPLTALAGAFANGTTTNARFNNPTDMDIDSNGNIYVADTGNHCIRKITPQGVVTTLAGFGGSAGYFDSTGTSARFSSPRGIAVDSSGNVFVADTGNNRIRRITPQGVVTTFAGTGVGGSANGSSEVATFNAPRGMSIDQYGNIYVADTGNNQVRKVRSDGRVSSAIRSTITIHECVSHYQLRSAISNIPPTNSTYWESRSYPIVYVDGIPYEANPDNTDVFKSINQYDYHRYDNNWMYQFGDLTSYNGQVYQCINTVPVGQPSSVITNIPPTNTLHWEEVNNDESLLTTVKVWINGSTYKIGDVIRYLTGLYRCKVGHVANNDDLPNRPPKWAVYSTYYPGAVVWAADTVYEENTIVVHNNKQYKCLAKHKSSSIETPNRVVKWTSVNQISALNIIEWDLNVQYLVGTIVIYNGYFYRCEVEHYSAYVDSPYGNKYYWTQITDLQSIGIPEFYDSNAEYTTKTVVSLRVPNLGLKKHDDDNYNVKFYKCIKTDPDYPYEFTYDTLAIVDSKDADGNYEYAKVPGTWNKHDLPRYGGGDDDPFRVPGFAGKLRRRVWMDIEMPHGRVEYLTSISVMIEKLGISETMSRMFSFISSNSQVITPTDYQTDYDFVKNKLQIVTNDFIATKTGTGEDKLSIEQVIANAYRLITEDIIARKTYRSPIDDDVNNGVDQLIDEVNVMKMQHFYNPATQAAIQADPYFFMSPIALAQNPPKKLFRDLGVGDLAEITASVNEQEGISNVTYNPDGTLTFGEGYGVATSAKRRYTRLELEYARSMNDLMNSKLELVSMSCFEVKQKIGFGIAMKMQASDSKMGGRFYCDSGTFDLPIGEYPVLPRYSNYGDTDKMMYNFYQLIQTSLKPPEYTLPESQATRDLAVLTFESQNTFVKGLSAAAKGIVGLTVSAFGGQVTGIADLINGIASLHAMVLRHQGKEVDEATEATIEMTNVNFVKFNQNNDSINSLKEQANYYREAAKRPLLPITEDQEKEGKTIEKLLATIMYLLRYVSDLERQAKFTVVERTINLAPPVELPIAPNQTRIVFQKPQVPENKALKSLRELKEFKDRLIVEKLNLENALARNYGHPSLPSFTKDIPTRQFEEVTRSIEIVPENVEEYKSLQKQTRDIEIRIAVQSRNITTNTELIRSSNQTLATTKTNFSYMDTLRNDMKTWIGPPAVTPDRTSVTVGNATFNPSTMTANQLRDLQKRVIDNHSLLRTNIANLEQTIVKAGTDIETAKVLREVEIQKLSAINTKTSSWLQQWRATNPNKSVTELIPEDDASFAKRVARYEAELEYHKAVVEDIQREAAASEMRRKAAIQGRLDLNKQELEALEKQMTEIELENKAIDLENQRAHAQYRAELQLAEAEEAVAETNYRKAYANYEKELAAAKYKNAKYRTEMKLAIKQAFDNAEGYRVVLDQKKQITAIKYTAFEEVLTAEYHITGSFVERLLKNAFAIPYEILATTLSLTMGIGEVPYRAQELITGRYFYNKLPAAARARIDLISNQLNAIPDKVGTRLQSVMQEHVSDFVTFINRRRRFIITVNKHPRLLKRGFGTIFAGRSGKAVSELVSSLKVATKMSLNMLGNTPTQRFLGGLGVLAEVAGAAMGAWQGGAFEEAATLGV